MCIAAPAGVAARPAAPAVAATQAARSWPARPACSCLLASPFRHRRDGLVAQAAPTSSGSSSSEAAPAAGAADVAAPLAVLREACRTKKVPPEEVIAAMEQVEAVHKQQGQVAGFPAALNGTWRLVFSAPSPIKAVQYIPILEYAVIDVEAGTIDLVSVVGPLDNAFKGTCSFEQDPATGLYAMHFSFTRIEAKWFGRWETNLEIKNVKQRTYTFFLLDDDVAAANSNRGPKTLMWRVK